jgi:glycosyltransferase involved in cell wall biosynthesis
MLPGSRKRAMQVVQKMSPGGIETMALDLAATAEFAGPIVSLAGDREGLVAAWPSLAASPAPLFALEQGKRSALSVLASLFTLFRRERPNVVVLHHIGPLLHGGLAARLAGVDQIIHIEHDAWHYDDPKHQKIARLCERLVRPRRIAVSDAVAERVRNVVPGAVVTVIPPGVDTARFIPADRRQARHALALPAAARIVGTIGRLVPVKGQTHLVAALQKLPTDVVLVIVGDGPEMPALEAQATAQGVAERVRFLGLRSDLERIVPAFDVFCLPSLAEGLPRALLEAQSCGIPAVASDVGGVSRGLAPGGRLTAVGDVEGLARAIQDVLAAPPPSDATRAFVEAGFSLAATTRKLDDVRAAAA